MLLTAFNGRDNAIDTYQELLDAIVYSECMIQESTDLDLLFWQETQAKIINLTTEILAKIEEKNGEI
jgi:hypothetical protein